MLKVISFRDICTYLLRFPNKAYLASLPICLHVIPNSLWSCWPILRRFDKSSRRIKGVWFEHDSWKEEARWRNESHPSWTSVRMVAQPQGTNLQGIIAYDWLHCSLNRFSATLKSIKNICWKLHCNWSRSLNEPKVSWAANKSHIPPTVKVNQLLCFYSRMKWIIVTLELKEEKTRHVTARFHPNCSNLNECYINSFKNTNFQLKNKQKNQTEVEHYSHFSILRCFILKGAGPAEQGSKATLFNGISVCAVNVHEKSYEKSW